MSWDQSWTDVTDWYDHDSVGPAYTWARFLVPLLRDLQQTEEARGLYAHRWATTVVVSRFGRLPDWAYGPRLELLPLHGGRLELRVFGPYRRKVYRRVLHEPHPRSDLTTWLDFVAEDKLP